MFRKCIINCSYFLLIVFIFALQNAWARSDTSKDSIRVRVAGIVLKWTPKDRGANYEHAEHLIKAAAEKGADIVCTAESFLDGYSVRYRDMSAEEFRSLAEPIPGGKYCKRLQRLADTLDIYLVAAVSELDSDKVYNSAALIGPDGKLIGKYRKKYLWKTENEKYSPGTSFPTFETEFGKIGMMICSDRRESEAIRELAENGAEIVFCPAGGGFGEGNDRMVAQRSKEGGIPIVFAHPSEFLVTGPSGEILESFLYNTDTDDSKKNNLDGIVRFYDLKLAVNTPKH